MHKWRWLHHVTHMPRFDRRIQIDTKKQIGQIANNGPDISTRHKLMHYYF